MSSTYRHATLAFSLAILLVGLAYIAIMPPFEGLDEVAHYSRLKATASLPDISLASSVEGKAVDAEVDDYQKIAPMPPYWLFNQKPSASLPIVMDEDFFAKTFGYPLWNEGHIYSSFFGDRARVQKYIHDYRQTPAASAYVAGREENWQYQHPPFYYIVAAPVMKWLGSYSLISRLLILRTLNYLLALAGIGIGCAATFKYMQDIRRPAAQSIFTLGLLYPFLAPSFWGEFGRLGNDNLCTFLFGVSWALLLRFMRKPQIAVNCILLGLFLALSWLTKATMISIIGGAILFLFFQAMIHKKKLPLMRRLMPVIFIALLCCIIGGSWQIWNSFHAHTIGSLEIQYALEDKNFLHNLREHLTLSQFFYGLYGSYMILIRGVYFYNSQSMPTPNAYIADIAFILFATVFLAYLKSVKNAKTPAFTDLPLWTIVPLFLGLVMHLVFTIAEFNVYMTPGHYLIMPVPAFSLIIGIGMQKILQKKGNLFLLTVFTVSLCTNLYAFWLQATIYGGCALKLNGNREYSLGPYGCLDQIGSIFNHIGILAWPVLGGISYLLGIGNFCYGFWMLRRAYVLRP